MFNLNFTILYVEDALTSAKLYAKLFGFQPVEASAGFCLFHFENGNKLGLWSKHTVVPATTLVDGVELAFPCLDETTLNEAVKLTASLGLAITQPLTAMEFGKTFVVTDPDGHRLRFFVPSAN
ncbi:VOC family protein [Leeia sp. TBRC 13508]|uniref:VOC family protein n=1 Tax=Leeia speluncae TaxID=2884804 RepID=A0ABS8D1F7_9NEIS|nr:VOC family protein [Leeia speluncae]MCB6182025.1 VOC family protein [Leeia speluncae]